MTEDSARGCGSDAENGYSHWCVKQTIVRGIMLYVEIFFFCVFPKQRYLQLFSLMKLVS